MAWLHGVYVSIYIYRYITILCLTKTYITRYSTKKTLKTTLISSFSTTSVKELYLKLDEEFKHLSILGLLEAQGTEPSKCGTQALSSLKGPHDSRTAKLRAGSSHWNASTSHNPNHQAVHRKLQSDREMKAITGAGGSGTASSPTAQGNKPITFGALP